MPLTSKGEEIKENMEKEYGEKKGESVFYASRNKGTISGVDGVGMECGDQPSTSPYYGDPVLDPTTTSIGVQPTSSLEQPTKMAEPIDNRDAAPSSVDTFAALGAMKPDQGDAWSRMTGNRDFSGDENSRMGRLPTEVSHRDMQRMAEGFNYNQGYASNPYGRK